MKKLFLAMLVLSSVLLLAACNLQGDGTNPSSASGKGKTTAAQARQAKQGEYDWSLPQLVYQQDGKIHFHDPASGQSQTLKEESDEVFNLAFDEASQTLYYTVVRDGRLGLKKATLADGRIKIDTLESLDVAKEKLISELQSEYSPLQIHDGKLLLMSDFGWDVYGFTHYNIYSIAENAWTKTGDWDIADELLGGMVFAENDANPSLVTRNQQLIYTGGKTQVVLSDKLDLKLDPEYGQEEIEYSAFSVSPDGAKISFMALLVIGDIAHGPLCIANADGSSQKVLVEDGIAGLIKPQWLGSELVFPRSLDEEVAEDEEVNPQAGRFRLMMTQGQSNDVKELAINAAAFTLIQGKR